MSLAPFVLTQPTAQPPTLEGRGHKQMVEMLVIADTDHPNYPLVEFCDMVAEPISHELLDCRGIVFIQESRLHFGRELQNYELSCEIGDEHRDLLSIIKGR